MAFIENTAFEARITNNQFDDQCNITGLYQASSENADCSAGLLCVRNGQLPCEGFTDVDNENAWYMNAAQSTVNANDVIYACNTYDVQYLSHANGNLFAVGLGTLGLGAPAGRYCTFTRIDFNGYNVYRFGVGNINADVGGNTFFTIANGLLVPAASAPATAGSIYFELRGTGNFVEGAQNSYVYYDLCAKTLTVAAGA